MANTEPPNVHTVAEHYECEFSLSLVHDNTSQSTTSTYMENRFDRSEPCELSHEIPKKSIHNFLVSPTSNLKRAHLNVDSHFEIQHLFFRLKYGIKNQSRRLQMALHR